MAGRPWVVGARPEHPIPPSTRVDFTLPRGSPTEKGRPAVLKFTGVRARPLLQSIIMSLVVSQRTVDLHRSERPHLDLSALEDRGFRAGAGPGSAKSRAPFSLQITARPASGGASLAASMFATAQTPRASKFCGNDQAHGPEIGQGRDRSEEGKQAKRQARADAGSGELLRC